MISPEVNKKKQTVTGLIPQFQFAYPAKPGFTKIQKETLLL
jgi:hypothetical protein